MNNQNNVAMIPMSETRAKDMGEAHKEMRNQFNELSLSIVEDNAQPGTAEEMMQILEVYSLLFKCSKSKAYVNIKFDVVDMKNIELASVKPS